MNENKWVIELCEGCWFVVDDNRTVCLNNAKTFETKEKAQRKLKSIMHFCEINRFSDIKIKQISEYNNEIHNLEIKIKPVVENLGGKK